MRYINPFETIPPIQICERALAGNGKVITTDDDLLIGCEREDQNGRRERHLLRYNKSSGVTTLLDSNCAHAAFQLENLHPDGWLMGRQPIPRSGPSCSYFRLNDATDNAVYASCYYLPDFDRRRPVVEECPPVEEVQVTHVVEDDVTLEWRGGANHVAWQVAYLPTDAATDSTAWEHALLVETTDTTLTLLLDTCSQLRVRGICDAEHSGPWSDAVEVCPQPHIGMECPPVEEVRVTHVVADDVTLAWHSGANHVAWQVTYLPTDAATDSTAWEHALLVETTDTTLTLLLDTCSQLRVRGICDAEHNGPWSDAVEACPQPHIGIAGGARQSSGPVLIPNPATEVVTVVDGATGVIERQVIEIEVFSPLGQSVMRLRGASLFNVADLASGTYMVKIRTPRGTTLRKLSIR